MARNTRNANLPSNIFSINWKEVREDLGFKVDDNDPVVQAVGRFQTVVFHAANTARNKRRANPHADAPLPEDATKLVAECGDDWVKSIQAQLSDVFKFAKFFAGARFPVFIEGRDESPYSRLVEGILRDPKLVGIEQEGFQSIEHFGFPFRKKEDASA